MKYGLYILTTVGILAMLIVAPLLGHQELKAKFDTSKTTTIKGVVTKFDWSNPQVHVFINVPDNSATKVSNWAVELESIVELQKAAIQQGFTETGRCSERNGKSCARRIDRVWSTSFTLAAGNKKMFDVPTGIQQPKYTAPAGPTPRWPDNQPKLGPANPKKRDIGRLPARHR